MKPIVKFNAEVKLKKQLESHKQIFFRFLNTRVFRWNISLMLHFALSCNSNVENLEIKQNKEKL